MTPTPTPTHFKFFAIKNCCPYHEAQSQRRWDLLARTLFITVPVIGAYDIWAYFIR